MNSLWQFPKARRTPPDVSSVGFSDAVFGDVGSQNARDEERS